MSFNSSPIRANAAYQDHVKLLDVTEGNAATEHALGADGLQAGEIKFKSSYIQRSKYAVFDEDEDSENVLGFLKTKWFRKPPVLVLSVNGALDSVTLSERSVQIFQSSLIHIINKMNAWVFTSGTNSGVMRIVGDSVKRNLHTNELNIIGIAAWNFIRFKDEILNSRQEVYYKKPNCSLTHVPCYAKVCKVCVEAQECHDNNFMKKKHSWIYDSEKEENGDKRTLALNPNHSHFMFVKCDSNKCTYGSELKFRVNLEKKLREVNSLVIQLVFEGGVLTLRGIEMALRNQLLVILLEGTKGCADLVIAAVKMTLTNKKGQQIALLSRVIELSEAIDLNLKNFEAHLKDTGKPFVLSFSEIDKELIKRIMKGEPECFKETNFDAIFGDAADEAFHGNLLRLGEEIENVISKALFALVEEKQFLNRSECQVKTKSIIEHLRNVLRTEFRPVINICNLFTKGKADDLAVIICDAAKKVIQCPKKRLELALAWDFYDFAEEIMIEDSEKYYHRVLEKSMDFKEQLFVKALLQNKHQMVNLFLENGVDLSKFLTYGLLRKIFNPAYDEDGIKRGPILAFLKKHKMFFKVKQDKISFACIDHTIRCMLFHVKQNTLMKDFDNSAYEDEFTEHPELNLFIWAILCDRIEISKIFWKRGKYQILHALIAVKIYNMYASTFPDYEEHYRNCAYTYEQMAIGVLDVFDEHTRNEFNSILLLRNIPFLNTNCLELAARFKCKCFVAHPSAQAILTDIWNDNIGKEIERTVDDRTTFEEIRNDLYHSNRTTFLCELHKPRVNCFLNAVSYIVFLALFSYTMLYEFTSFKITVLPEGNNTEGNTTFNTTRIDGIYGSNMTKTTLGLFVALIVWIFSLFLEEIRQVRLCTRPSVLAVILFISFQLFFTNLESYTLTGKLHIYFSNGWNIYDIAGLCFYVIAFILRIVSALVPHRNESIQLLVYSKIAFCVDLTIWYIRFLQFCIIFKNLGPKLVMITKMIAEHKSIILLMSVIVMAFGTTVQALLYDHEEFSLIKSIFYNAYWPIFGELTVLETISNPKPGTHPAIIYYIFFAFVIYMVLASIILINLIISMFNSTFERLHENSNTIWKNQKYRLIMEYSDKTSSILPPPLNLLFYGIKMMSLLVKSCKRNSLDNQEKMSNIDAENEMKIQSLIIFEQKCAEEFLRRKEVNKT